MRSSSEGDTDLVEIIERPTTVVTLTETAAMKIRQLMAEEPEGDVSVLRVAIQGGGCSGFQYGLGFDHGAQEGDIETVMHGVTVVVDPFSAPYLVGSQIDFVDGLQESGFKIENPNATSACGCGHSFQVEEGDEAAAHGHTGGCGSGCSH
jgi:iron-sulfur cluster assembly protein